MVKPSGMACEMIGVYVAENFKVRWVEGGFEISNERDGLATLLSWWCPQAQRAL